jgi:hypothetical protein
MLANIIQGYQYLYSQKECANRLWHILELQNLLHQLDTVDKTSNMHHAEALDNY